MAVTGLAADNPLLVPSDLPFGYPRFDLVRDEHFRSAYAQGMLENLREVTPSPATRRSRPSRTLSLH
ncbi:MAG: hypothetical protein IPL39_11585 [Opitutaceae bacterium]|nr:hypothetical protein [Opitutaceae bacterium]